MRYERLRDAFMAKRAALEKAPAHGRWWDNRGGLHGDRAWRTMVEASLPPCVCDVCRETPAPSPPELATDPGLIARATVGTLCAAECQCWHCEEDSAALAESDAIDCVREGGDHVLRGGSCSTE